MIVAIQNVGNASAKYLNIRIQKKGSSKSSLVIRPLALTPGEVSQIPEDKQIRGKIGDSIEMTVEFYDISGKRHKNKPETIKIQKIHEMTK